LDEGSEARYVVVVLTYAVVGPVSEAGEVSIRASNEKIVSHTPIDEMKERARAFHEKHREQTETPLP
jgi:hypothetical protein